jgi:hypothetical protein
MEEIKINDKVYVLKSDIKERDAGIIDATNVAMFFRINSDWIDNSFLTLPKPDLLFKENGTIEECSTDYNRTKINTKQGTIISFEYIKKANALINAMVECNKGNKMNDLTIWEGWDEDKKQFKKDFPVFLSYGSYGMLIAPRLEQ